MMDTETHTKVLGYSEHTIPSYSLSDFQAHFRLTQGAFEILLQELGHMLVCDVPPGGKPEVSADKQLLVSIWTLSNQESFRSVADRFGIGKGTAHRTLMKVCTVINTIIMPKYIKWPNLEHVVQMSKGNNIPGMIGAIDGTHIAIRVPSKDPECYYNRKKFPSVILQAVCDSKLEFIDIFAGYPGSVHDARVLRNSPLYSAAENRELFATNTFVLGDAAYPLRSWLMCPFRDNGHLTKKQKVFNTAIASERSIIERAFGLLKGRFRRLKHLDMRRTDLITEIIFSACTLHNFCLRHEADATGVESFLTEGSGEENVPAVQLSATPETDECEHRRTDLMNLLVVT